MKKIPNLDTLRFFAASLVILQHIELYKSSLYSESLWHIAFFRIIGCLGVAMFFVLSSFLITTLLLNEQKSTGTISLKNFYFRRILKIWPLYYLIIFLGFFVLPNVEFFQMPAYQYRFGDVNGNTFLPNFMLYFFGISSMGRTLFGDIAFVSHTWTLATEQLFYLLWPMVLIYFSKRLLTAMLLIILLYHVTSYFLVTKYAYAIPYSRYIFSFLSGIYIPCMAFGGIFAVVLNRKMRLLSLLHHPIIFYASLIASVLLSFVIKNFTIYHYGLYSVLFGIIILNLASNPKFSNVLENRVTNYLGTISYGMYMYHPIIIFIAIKVALIFSSVSIIYLLSFIVTIFISHLSFKYFEGYFLRLKTKFESI